MKNLELEIQNQSLKIENNLIENLLKFISANQGQNLVQIGIKIGGKSPKNARDWAKKITKKMIKSDLIFEKDLKFYTKEYKIEDSFIENNENGAKEAVFEEKKQKLGKCIKTKKEPEKTKKIKRISGKRLSHQERMKENAGVFWGKHSINIEKILRINYNQIIEEFKELKGSKVSVKERIMSMYSGKNKKIYVQLYKILLNDLDIKKLRQSKNENIKLGDKVEVLEFNHKGKSGVIVAFNYYLMKEYVYIKDENKKVFFVRSNNLKLVQ